MTIAIVDRAGGLRTMVDHHSIASAGLPGFMIGLVRGSRKVSAVE
jgi:hypothetical protein